MVMAHQVGWSKPRVHTDTCARCGCDRKEQRRGKFRCKAGGVFYSSHIWGWNEDTGPKGPLVETR